MDSDVVVSTDSSIVVVAAHPKDIKNCTCAVTCSPNRRATMAVIQVTDGERLDGAALGGRGAIM